MAGFFAHLDCEELRTSALVPQCQDYDVRRQAQAQNLGIANDLGVDDGCVFAG